MKMIKTYLVAICILSVVGNNFFAQDRKKALEEIAKKSDIIFEGILIKKGATYYTDKQHGGIATPFYIKVASDLLGNIIGDTVKIVFQGVGEIDSISGFKMDGINGILSGYSLFFCKKSDNEFSLNSQTEISNPENILAEVDYHVFYTKLSELYADLKSVTKVKIPDSSQKKSADFSKEKNVVIGLLNEQLKNRNYIENISNYNTYFDFIDHKAKKNKTLQSSFKKSNAVNDINLYFANSQLTGSTTKFFEFDIMMYGTNGTWFDNVLMRIDYNPSAFGTNIVANNKITITKGSSFNTPTYIDPDANVIDQTATTIGIPFGSDFNQTSLVRTAVGSSAQQLVHIKIEVKTCGTNTNIGFTDIGFTPMFSFFTNNAFDPITSSISYDNTYYGPILDKVLCINILDFNSPINAGVDDGINDILEIKGGNFGATRGNGQVKFRNADKQGFPYIQKLDNKDYISWNDSVIKIKVPSVVDTIGGTISNSPGTGSFIIRSNAGDSTMSYNNLLGNPFKIYYSISNKRAILLGVTNKLKNNLADINNFGGYTIRLDTSISYHPERVMCVKKAVKEWRCLTAINLIIGSDTIFPVTIADKISVIYFTSSLPSTVVAATSPWRSVCSGTIAFIRDFDIEVNSSKNYFYDTTGATLPIGKFDFYEVMLHEIGHGIGLMHVIDTTAVMYYTSIYSNTFSIPGNQRRTLQIYSSESDGGFFQLNSSISNLNSQCGLVDMDPVTGNSCTITGINEQSAIKGSVTIFPNPSNIGKITVSLHYNEKETPTISILNLLGEHIYSTNTFVRDQENVSVELNTEQFPKGIYLVVIRSRTINASAKMIIQ